MIDELLRKSIRLLTLIAALVTVAAIGLPFASPNRTRLRIACPSSYQVLGSSVTAFGSGEPLLVDLEKGRLEQLPLPPGLRLDAASLSPWTEDGRRQLAGIGLDRSGSGPSFRHNEVSNLVRVSFPDGEVLNRLSLADEALPAGPPCWIPGPLAAVLYAGCDCRLYRADFELRHADGRIDNSADSRPRLVDWQIPILGAGDFQLRDVAWADDARLGGRLLASLCFRDRATGRYTDCQIWWLRLDSDANSVVAAGQLLEIEAKDSPILLRFPNLISLRATPALSYFVQRPGESGYQLRIAPIQFDADSRTPHARDAESICLAEDCWPTSAVASPDARWITVVHTRGSSVRAERITIPCSAGPEPPNSARLLAGPFLKTIHVGPSNPG